MICLFVYKYANYGAQYICQTDSNCMEKYSFYLVGPFGPFSLHSMNFCLFFSLSSLPLLLLYSFVHLYCLCRPHCSAGFASRIEYSPHNGKKRTIRTVKRNMYETITQHTKHFRGIYSDATTKTSTPHNVAIRSIICIVYYYHDSENEF